VRVIHQKNRGLPATRNVGAAAAGESGWDEYLVFLDGDDYLEPTFVARLHEEMLVAQDPERSVSHVYCQERLVDQATGIWTVPEWDSILLLVTNLHPVTTLVRRECFEAVGGFDESMRLGYEDWELWVRFSLRGWRGARVREPLFNWRRHSDITMIVEAVARHDDLYVQIMERHKDAYSRHAFEIMRRANALLRRGDANWLDESHQSIPLRDMRLANEELYRDNCRIRDWNQSLEKRLRKAGLLPAALPSTPPPPASAAAASSPDVAQADNGAALVAER